MSKLPLGIYKIVAEGNSAVFARRLVGGDISSDIRVGSFEDKTDFKWLIQNVQGITYRITNEGLGDYPHPANDKSEFVHGEFSEYKWEIEFAGDGFFHILKPDIDLVWTIDPDREEIVLRPNVDTRFQKFTFEYLQEN